jgi:acyl carrier protein
VKEKTKMTREDVYERLVAVFRDVLDDDSIELNDNTVADDVEGWDSFEHINLISGVEEEFSFKIPMGKVVTMKNVGEMVDIILEMGK